MGNGDMLEGDAPLVAWLEEHPRGVQSQPDK